MQSDSLDNKLTQVFAGKAVRKICFTRSKAVKTFLRTSWSTSWESTAHQMTKTRFAPGLTR